MRIPTDSDSMAYSRHQMVELQLRRRGIRDEQILKVMEEIPRELFVPDTMVEHAYEDRAMDINYGQTISQPYIVAYMTERLDLEPTHRVLEVGTGSGYQAAILSALCETVYTVECIAELSRAAQAILKLMGRDHVKFRVSDGTLGWQEEAPFDRIMVTAAAPDIPSSLVDQLRIGGKMILPTGSRDQQRLTLIEKRDKRFIELPLIGCRFVKLVGKFGWPS